MSEENNTTLDKSIFKKYADIKQEIKRLTEEAKEIETSVASEMESVKADKVQSDFGTFYFTTRKKWTYPEYVNEAENTYKEVKKKAEETGEAKFEEIKNLSYRE